MSLGIRVLRGPDWDQNEADGGEGHLGTVVGVKVEEGTAEVVWDNGQATRCRVGKEGKHDLRVLDNAQAGERCSSLAPCLLSDPGESNFAEVCYCVYHQGG